MLQVGGYSTRTGSPNNHKWIECAWSRKSRRRGEVCPSVREINGYGDFFLDGSSSGDPFLYCKYAECEKQQSIVIMTMDFIPSTSID